MWKNNWQETKTRFNQWWAGRGVLIGSWNAPRRGVANDPSVLNPGPASSVEAQWTDLEWRLRDVHYQAANALYPLETLPVADPWLGPGSMALYLGSAPGFSTETLWYHPCISDPDNHPKIRFDPTNRWWKYQCELIQRMISQSQGKYLVGCPDVIENWDTLASLRDAQTLLMDILDRPEWVKEKIAQINQAWFQSYERYYDLIRQQDGESMFGWFRLWAPGKVAKVQCDGCSMLSPAMFDEFVVPALSAQCQWLDYSMYHLDGSSCLCHLDSLLNIESLTAIEWTPDPKVPSGGSSHWYTMYKQILQAGKRVQVLGALPHEIEPLLDACGSDGIYFLCFMGNEADAEAYQKVADRIR